MRLWSHRLVAWVYAAGRVRGIEFLTARSALRPPPRAAGCGVAAAQQAYFGNAFQSVKWMLSLTEPIFSTEAGVLTGHSRGSGDDLRGADGAAWQQCSGCQKSLVPQYLADTGALSPGDGRWQPCRFRGGGPVDIQRSLLAHAGVEIAALRPHFPLKPQAGAGSPWGIACGCFVLDLSRP
jgi:hypothetical protein